MVKWWMFLPHTDVCVIYVLAQIITGTCSSHREGFKKLVMLKNPTFMKKHDHYK